MTTAIIKGSSAPQYQFWEQNFSRWNQCSSTQVWKSIDLAAISAIAQSYYDAGYSGTLRYEHQVASLTVTAPTLDLAGGGGQSNGNIVDKWEISVDRESPELFENQYLINLFHSADIFYGVPISQQVFAVIRQVATSALPRWPDFIIAMNATKAVTYTGDEIVPNVTLGAIVNSYSLAQALKYFVDDYFRGATVFYRGKYTLKHTTFAPNSYSANVADFNVEKIYSISQLISECQNGSLWVLPIPTFLTYKIIHYPVPVAIPPNYMFGALKMRALAVLAARGRIEISTEYLIDSWPIHAYGTI